MRSRWRSAGARKTVGTVAGVTVRFALTLSRGLVQVTGAEKLLKEAA